jgi:glycerophosphoryl diester phosphodiesterase
MLMEFGSETPFHQELEMWKYPRIISHRGGGFLAPENTMAAMEVALFYHNYAVEFDVMLSKDNIPIIIHDSELGRTVTGIGNISDLNFDELMQLDAGLWWNLMFEKFENEDPIILAAAFPHLNCQEIIHVIKKLPKFHYLNEKIPSFEALASFCKSKKIWMNIEIKPAPGFDQITGEIVSRLTKEMFGEELSSLERNYSTLPLFSSFSYDSLMSAKITAPEIPRSFLTETIPSNWKNILMELEAENLHCDHLHLTESVAKEIKSSGYGLACYTVNDLARAQELFSWGVDAIFTDRVDLLEHLNLIR